MKLKIFSPEKEILNQDVDHVVLPGLLGQMDILAGHAKLVSLLKKGKIKYYQNKLPSLVEINGGMVEVGDNAVTVMTNQ